MKAIKFLPLTFFAGIHGFGLFAPYAVLFLSTLAIVRWRRPAGPVLTPVPA